MNRFDILFAGRASSYLPNEGLIVLLCDMMRSLERLGAQVVVHTTDRHEPSLRRALEVHGLDPSRFDLRAYRVASAGLHRQPDAGRRKARGDRPVVRHARQVAGLLRQAVRSVLLWSRDGALGDPLRGVLVAPLAAVALALLAIPVAVFAFVGALALGARLIVRRGPWLVARFGLARWIPPELRAAVARVRSMRSGVQRDVDEELYRREQHRFAQALNASRDVDSLFLFTAFEGELVRELRHRTVVVFPDATPLLFPTRFAGAVAGETLRQMGLAMRHAAGIVCYSEFVRDRQLLPLYPEAAAKPIAVIPQGYFPFRVDDPERHRREAIERLNGRRDIVANVFPELLRSPPLARFGEFDYVLYPTIDRQHKNALTLLRACAYLLRSRYRNLKVVLTTPRAMPEAHDFILRERLQYDVLFVPSVPGDVLDELCAAATVVVHPSLAEGGDVFNFSRAVSNGTPALLADIPVVREMFERVGFDEDAYGSSLFDPFDDRALARRIDSILDDRGAALFARQKALLSRLSVYGYPEMATNYLNFMKKVRNGQAHPGL